MYITDADIKEQTDYKNRWQYSRKYTFVTGLTKHIAADFW